MNEFVRHLRRHDTALRVPRAGAVLFDDEAVHASAYLADPQRYALTALTPGILASQRARMLLQLLLTSRAGLGDAGGDTLARVTRVLALGLPPADVLTVLLAARRRRANHKHVARTALTVLLEHPRAAEIVAARRAVVQDCFEHALGRGAARAALDAVRRGSVPRHRLLRSAPSAGAVASLVPLVYEHRAGTALVPLPATGGGLDLSAERPATVTATNRGDLAATLVHLLRGGPSDDLWPAVERYTDAAVAGLPRYEGTVALVLDESASMRGYGEREWAVASQVAALRLVLQRVCARLVVVPVGGASPGGLVGRSSSGGPGGGPSSDGPGGFSTGGLLGGPSAVGPVGGPSAAGSVGGASAAGSVGGASAAGSVGGPSSDGLGGFSAGGPGGATDLATGVLDALSGAHAPDVVAVVSDGYENVYPGDLAWVTAALPGAGVRTPVVFCQATFGHADDLTLRRPAPSLPQLPFWHTDDLAPLVLWLLSHVDGAAADRWIVAELRRRLAILEVSFALEASVEGRP
ncbi:hypothetical protein [Dactylosporangium sp. NPDC000521]|uniref:hypothetical protein n=1 Tax=Dactylosporangium sp. NPDC000521 TaxID=3363975 RepID=UPI0036A670E6